MTVKIKKLQWFTPLAYSDSTVYAESILGTWAVWEIFGDGYYKSPDSRAGVKAEGGMEAAKKAAQDQFERIVRLAIEE